VFNAIEYGRLFVQRPTWLRALLCAWPVAAFWVTLFFVRFLFMATPQPIAAEWLDATWRMAMAILVACASTLQALIFALGIWPRESEGG